MGSSSAVALFQHIHRRTGLSRGLKACQELRRNAQTLPQFTRNPFLEFRSIPLSSICVISYLIDLCEIVRASDIILLNLVVAAGRVVLHDLGVNIIYTRRSCTV